MTDEKTRYLNEIMDKRKALLDKAGSPKSPERAKNKGTNQVSKTRKVSKFSSKLTTIVENDNKKKVIAKKRKSVFHNLLQIFIHNSIILFDNGN